MGEVGSRQQEVIGGKIYAGQARFISLESLGIRRRFLDRLLTPDFYPRFYP